MIVESQEWKYAEKNVSTFKWLWQNELPSTNQKNKSSRGHSRISNSSLNKEYLNTCLAFKGPCKPNRPFEGQNLNFHIDLDFKFF